MSTGSVAPGPACAASAGASWRSPRRAPVLPWPGSKVPPPGAGRSRTADWGRRETFAACSRLSSSSRSVARSSGVQPEPSAPRSPRRVCRENRKFREHRGSFLGLWDRSQQNRVKTVGRGHQPGPLLLDHVLCVMVSRRYRACRVCEFPQEIPPFPQSPLGVRPTMSGWGLPWPAEWWGEGVPAGTGWYCRGPVLAQIIAGRAVAGLLTSRP